MAGKGLNIINVDDYQLSRVQDSVDSAVREINGGLFSGSNGVLLNNISLKSGVEKQIAHKLGRVFQVWTIVRKNSQADVWEIANSSTFSADKFVILKSSADTTISLWVA